MAMRRVTLALLLLLPAAPSLGATACPDRLPEIAPAPFERQGLGAGRGARSALRETWLIDGAPGEETAGAPTILAPDTTRGRPPRVVNAWTVAPGDQRLLVCIYDGGVWLRAALPAGTRRCEQVVEPPRMTMRCE
jgi:hypothetical protein